jgi:hypothetical protein
MHLHEHIREHKAYNLRAKADASGSAVVFIVWRVRCCGVSRVGVGCGPSGPCSWYVDVVTYGDTRLSLERTCTLQYMQSCRNVDCRDQSVLRRPAPSRLCASLTPCRMCLCKNSLLLSTHYYSLLTTHYSLLTTVYFSSAYCTVQATAVQH